MVFRKKTMTPDRYRHVKRQHGEEAAEFEKKLLTFFSAECLSCGAKSEEGNEFEYAIKNWNEAKKR